MLALGRTGPGDVAPATSPVGSGAIDRCGTPDPPAGDRFLVVIPAKDAEETLPACLAALAASRVRPESVVVVDDGSSDDTAAVAEASGATVLRPEGAPVGPGRARDFAVARTGSTGGSEPPGIVVLVDADVAVHPDALGRLVGELRSDPGVVAAFGSYDDDPPAPAIASRYANLRHHFVHQQAGGEAASFWAGLGAVRRDAWNAVGGFGNRYDRPAIEDIDLGRRLVGAGGRIRCRPEAQATHLKAWTLRQLWRTDVFQRALPWSRLIIREPSVVPVPPPGGAEGEPSKLNTGRGEQLSALAVHGAWFGLLLTAWLHPLAALIPLLCLLAWGWLNRSFLGLLHRRGGLRLLLGGGLLHAMYHAYASVAFAWVLLETRWQARGIARLAALLPVLLASAVAATLLAVSILPSETLSGLLLRASGGDGPLQAAAAGAGSTRVRAALLSGFFAAVAATAALLGPAFTARLLADLGPTLRAAVRPLRNAWWIAGVGVLAAWLAVRIIWHLDQPFRADEAQSFYRVGGGSVLYPIVFWTSPNNHILHSVLLRCSVILFGDAPWAVRLPAAAVTIAATPLVFLGLRQHLGTAAGFLACVLWAGSAYAVDLGTNARGYPIVVAATLLLLVLAPRVRSGRPAATALASVAAALGAWAVPVMLLPFSALVAYVVFWRGRRLGAAAVRGGLLAAGTGTLTLALYAPALLLVSPAGTGAASAVRDTMAPLGVAERFAMLGRNVGQAWEQMAFPLEGAAALALATVVAAGAAMALLLGRRSRVLVLSAVGGPAAALVLLGVPPLPWWTLGFAFPVALGFGCFLSSAVVARFVGNPPPPGLLACGGLLLALQTAVSTGAGYPQRYPQQLGFGDAPAAAVIIRQLLDEPDAAPLRVYAGPARRTSLAYHLLRLGRERGETPHPGTDIVPGAEPFLPDGSPRPPREGERVLLVQPHDREPVRPGRLLRGLAAEPEQRFRLDDTDLLLFAPAESPSGSPFPADASSVPGE